MEADPPADVDWCFARDGTLTGRIGDGWIGGSSVPSLVAERLADRVDVPRDALCLVAPNHAQHVIALLDRLPKTANLLAVLTDANALATAMCCADWSNAIQSGRLRLLAGADVAADIVRLANDQLEWAVPKQLVVFGDTRAVQDGDAVAAVQNAAQRGLRDAAEERARQVAAAVTTTQPATHDIALLAGLNLRLPRSAGSALAAALAEDESRAVRVVDVDDPRSASTLIAANAAAAAQCVVTPDLTRSDLPNVVAASTPWLAWVATHRPPVPWREGSDVILLADERWQVEWLTAGWPRDRVRVAGWPVVPREVTGRTIAVVADLPPREPPADIAAYSSAAVVWEQLAADVEADPWKAVDPERLVENRHARAGLACDDATVARWQRGCVQPAVTRGLVARLRASDTPLRLIGTGWDDGPGVVGAVESDADLQRHLRDVAALLDAAFAGDPAIRTLGLPLVRPGACAADLRQSLANPRPAAANASLRAALHDVLDNWLAR